MVVVVGLMAVTRPAAVTSAMAFVLFGEKFDAIAMVGMAVCALAVFVVNRRQ
jgi:drug/metabolite transporter (DMT)-like permease